MKPIAFVRIGATLVIVALASLAGQRLWTHYEVEPWTRDGRIRADVVQVAPDVSGLVTRVLVRDNQPVTAGMALFEVDRPRYQLGVAQAGAALAAQQAQFAQARREARRDVALGDLVAGEVREQGLSRVEQLAAAVDQARVQLATARLDLARTLVKASVAGMVTNFDLRPGDYATSGRAEFAIIDRSSIHVIGYFEETKLPRIHVGDVVQIRLMGDDRTLRGHVQSIAGGIEERDRSVGPNLLADVNPTFSWVRLAQRIPVRVSIDSVPPGDDLVVGQTATVTVLSRAKPLASPAGSGS